jgi:hypothetical protein
MKQLKKLR